MAAQPTIPNIIQLAKICQYLASNDVDKDGYFDNGSLDKLLPLKIYDIRKAVEWGQNQNYIATAAIGSFLIEGVLEKSSVFDFTFDGTFGSAKSFSAVIKVKLVDPVSGLITIGTYVLTTTDTSNEIIAQHVASAINGSGYSAISNGAMVVVTAPFILGSSINGVYLIVTITPYFPNIFDQTFSNIFN